MKGEGKESGSASSLGSFARAGGLLGSCGRFGKWQAEQILRLGFVCTVPVARFHSVANLDSLAI